MRLKVTEEGLLIPKKLLRGAEEADVRKGDRLIVIIPDGRATNCLSSLKADGRIIKRLFSTGRNRVHLNEESEYSIQERAAEG